MTSDSAPGSPCRYVAIIMCTVVHVNYMQIHDFEMGGLMSDLLGLLLHTCVCVHGGK